MDKFIKIVENMSNNILTPEFLISLAVIGVFGFLIFANLNKKGKE